MTIKELLINEQIRERFVMVIDDEGKNVGTMTRENALEMAASKGLDLVRMSSTADGKAVCKIIDYGKLRYDEQKKRKEIESNKPKEKVKEIQLSYNIQKGDMLVRAKKANEFLKEGHKVKIVLYLRGRERAREDIAINVVKEFYSMLENAKIFEEAKREGNNIRMIVVPNKK